MAKKVLVAIPPTMIEQIDYIARLEHRTRSELIREALRRYIDNFRRAQASALGMGAVGSPEISSSILT